MISEKSSEPSIIGGVCCFCSQVFGPRRMVHHLQTCAIRREKVFSFAGDHNPTRYHTVISQEDGRSNWIHVEVDSQNRLEDLQEFILHYFFPENSIQLIASTMDQPDQILGNIFLPGMKMSFHDQGGVTKSPKLLLRVISMFTGQSGLENMILMAKSLQPTEGPA